MRLLAYGIRVDLELGSHARRGVEALGEDTVARTVLPEALPRHHEIPGRRGGNLGILLIAGRIGVDSELGAEPPGLSPGRCAKDERHHGHPRTVSSIQG